MAVHNFPVRHFFGQRVELNASQWRRSAFTRFACFAREIAHAHYLPIRLYPSRPATDYTAMANWRRGPAAGGPTADSFGILRPRFQIKARGLHSAGRNAGTAGTRRTWRA